MMVVRLGGGGLLLLNDTHPPSATSERTMSQDRFIFVPLRSVPGLSANPSCRCNGYHSARQCGSATMRAASTFVRVSGAAQKPCC